MGLDLDNSLLLEDLNNEEWRRNLAFSQPKKIPRPNGILLDGFPRDIVQGIDLENAGCSPALVLHFTCPKAEAKKRYLSRGRENDDGALFEKRYHDYEMTNPVILAGYRELVMNFDTTAEPEVSYEKLLYALGANEKSSWVVRK